MENRYTNGEAAKQLGTTKNSIYRWETRALKVRRRLAEGLPLESKDAIWKDFPIPRRNAHSRHRVFTDGDIKQIRDWKDRTVDLVA